MFVAVTVSLAECRVGAASSRRFTAGQMRHGAKELLRIVVIVPSSRISMVNLSICMALSSPEHGRLAVTGRVRAPLQLPAEFARLALNHSL